MKTTMAEDNDDPELLQLELTKANEVTAPSIGEKREALMRQLMRVSSIRLKQEWRGC
jgi:hypothetical protein